MGMLGTFWGISKNWATYIEHLMHALGADETTYKIQIFPQSEH